MPQEEKTFLMVKPDGVHRGLVGEIIRRVEQRNLKIIALAMVTPSREKFDGHYPKDPAWIKRLGEKTLATYQKYGYDAAQELGTEKPEEIGPLVRNWLLDFMMSGPVVKMIVQGVHAVDMVRKISGSTMPSVAEMGTIRGDFSVDSAASANRDRRAVHNLVHASETQEEASHEISFWFTPDEIHSYKRTDEQLTL
ncbi:MAG: nucleoside-diphosphate kinase [Candidatus Ryanbacteria bacterium RIFCSPHIGHO2_12_FULL_47_12b]|uniref:nucleoside-diphosphate kinase n=2 Tax=Candidatus Ryaniibacteriota TaxID=1817914 RepID=A0A1G2H6M2_9BACT|nr:MAG: Nucleoside diphosphate kinase [Parcubacteria group bacterium GW2011_GWA2_47_10b]KKU85264.1 MAG: Nucleoside diphosphate kinase [Parcubacteria group bacterium GW2011_GWA1_47_9]OGZ45996.1 MAG: nucleoside-diphosphate kinase [Candidatus Ryanbacteria bacterium RIFCSPHIGHO2_01_FULL_48_80]OGZ49386.1 MAG: nucleoside-diphosphate kinase [Candidatus Ryanbacteria bacterium RIFCSPHIGHO2_02_FULL_47_25]OGZ52427.1 MAG: nucleoside-diphosphate kinase [Candidatus Ryanbacteria bacterium RIFCSPLOWO2_01_FULL_